MGVVYAAHDPELDRKVALKILRGELWRDERASDGSARLLREAQAMARLSHPNVVAVHDVGSIEGQVFVAAEYVEGWNLRQWLKLEPRSWREVVRVYLEAGKGLAAAHAAGLVHRDFKPDNVLVGKDGRVRVTDFGLARPTASVEPPGPELTPGGRLAAQLTQAGTVMGTPAYMSPEQHAGKPVDARGDQFSLAAALYEGVYGELPWKGLNTVGMVVSSNLALVREPPTGARVPRRLRRLLLKALSPEPADRYPSVDAFLAQLERVLGAAPYRWAALAAAVAVAVAVPLGTRFSRERAHGRCLAGSEAARSVWSEPQRQQVRETFMRSGQPFAEGAFHAATRRLEAYLEDWASSRADACAATYRRREQSAEQLELRLTCFEDRLRDFRALVETMGTADASLVQRSAESVASLSPLSHCADLGALSAREPPPEGEGARQEVASLRDRLAKAASLKSAGRYKDGLGEAIALMPAVRELRYEPLEAEALLLEGQLRFAVGDIAAAEPRLLEALATAESGRHEEVRVHAANTLAEMLAARGETDRAAAFLKLSRAALARLAARPELEGRQLFVEAKLENGNPEGARAKYRAALDRFDASVGPESYEAAAAHNGLGHSLKLLGRYDEAEKHFRRSIEVTRKVRGRLHPNAATQLGNLAILLESMERFEEARGAYQDQLEVIEAVTGVGAPPAAYVRMKLGSQLWRLGRQAEAEAELSLAEPIIRKAVGEQHPWRAELGLSTGALRLTSDRPGKARPHFERALAIIEGSHLGEALAAMPLFGVGASLLLEGSPKKAVAPLERALESSAKRKPWERALVQAYLGRALLESRQDARRAQALMAEAVPLLAPEGRVLIPAYHPRIAEELEAWLRSRRLL
ncbi:MAG: serine/threonine protein kinase [Myxococcales bacterium]|nr:serine/threonine protein kinase [Myxococcales bacterium]